MSGTLSAPGGALAFNAPTGPQRLLAEIFGRDALAALSGTSPVAGAAVKLIQIDSSGAPVGSVLASTTTAADGSFTLNVPTPFTPGPSFVIRATGTVTLDRMVSDFTSQDVDPSTDVTKSLVLAQLQAAGANIQTLKASQVSEIGTRVAQAAVNLGTFGSVGTLVTALTTQVQNDVEIQALVGNSTATSGISGTVTDGGGTPLANIKIVVRDFRQQIRRAEARTDASGNYALNISSGDYMVGALNLGTASTAASEWWTCNDVNGGPVCGVAVQNKASKVSVAAGTSSANFKLEPGARISGSMTAAGAGTLLGGVELVVRDFDSTEIAFSRLSDADGSFVMNVGPGVYSLSSRNQTNLAFAGAPYNGPATGGSTTNGGGAHTNESTPVSLAAGNSFTFNFALVEGGLVKGTVTDGATPTPNPVAGLPVRFSTTNTALNDLTGAFLEAVSTDLAGGYRMWVKPGTYAVRARGQIATPTVVGFGANNNPAPVNFGAAVGRATVVVQAPGGLPLSGVKVQVYDSNGNFVGSENTIGDGSIEIYALAGASYRIQFLLDDGSTAAGSVTYDGTSSPTQRVLASGTLVAFTAGSAATPIQLGTITLPVGGGIEGTVTIGGIPAGNVVVQVRSGGFGGASRFVNTRTSEDGTYSIAVPAGAYERVCAFVTNALNTCPNQATPSSALLFGSADGVSVASGEFTTADIAIPGAISLTGVLSNPGGTVAGTTMRLIQINSAGGQVGADIATAVTGNDGSFTFHVNGAFAVAPSSVITAAGVPTLDRMISGTSGQDVSPATTVTKSLVLSQLASAAANIASLKLTQPEQIANRVANAVFDLLPADSATSSTQITALTSDAQNDVQISNSVGNLTATSAISGTITDSNGAPLGNLKVQVRDFKQWIVRAEARTNPITGQFVLNVAPGDYIVGALNYSSTSTAASEWWTCNDVALGPTCGAASMLGAAKVTVTAGTVPVNFKLEPGARITGTITTNNGLSLPGIQLGVRDFDAGTAVIFQDTKTDNTYLVNVRPGSYTLSARNQTAAFFGSATYNGPAAGGTAPNGSGSILAQATKVTVTAGNTVTANFKLQKGNLVQGNVTDNNGVAVANQVVRFGLRIGADTSGAFTEDVRTKLDGSYRLWVQPGPSGTGTSATYNVRARGQTVVKTVTAFDETLPPVSTPPIAASFNQSLVVPFTQVVGIAQGTIKAPDSTPLSQLRVLVFDGTTSTNLQEVELTNNDGTIEIYGVISPNAPNGLHQIQYLVENGSTTAGTALDDTSATPVQQQQQTALNVDFSGATVNPIQLGGAGTITLPSGGELRGTVTLTGVAAGNIVVQVRQGGVNGTARVAATRTASDGSYSISLQGGVYDRVCAFVAGTANACPLAGTGTGQGFSAGAYGSADGVTVTNGQSVTADIAIP
jgi:hypothetical protein